MMRKLLMFVNCWVRLPQHKGNRATCIYVAVLSKSALTLSTVLESVTVVISEGGQDRELVV